MGFSIWKERAQDVEPISTGTRLAYQTAGVFLAVMGGGYNAMLMKNTLTCWYCKKPLDYGHNPNRCATIKKMFEHSLFKQHTAPSRQKIVALNG